MSELLRYILEHEDAFKSKARLTSLYSDFSRLKTTNPDGYRANISAWTSALTGASRAGVAPGNSQLSIAGGEQLAKELESKTLGRPVALGAVFAEAVDSGEMIPLDAFLQAQSSIYLKPGWMPQVHIPSAWEVAQWGLRQVGFGGRGGLVQGEFVIKANVEAASRAVLKHISQSVNASVPSTQVYSLETFTSTLNTILQPTHLLTETETSILLTHLRRDVHACAISHPHPHPSTPTTIKFSPSTTTTTSTKSRTPPTITPRDTTLAHLLTLHSTLTTQITTLTTRTTALTSQIAALLPTSSSNPAAKSQTLSLLRARKAATATLERRHASLLLVEGCVAGIDEAAGQVEMVAAMEESRGVLRELNRRVGGVEGVEGVVEGWREEMGVVEEVGGVLSGVGGEGVDEGEVEEELEAMVEEGRRKEGEKEEASVTVGTLPDVPSSEPGIVADGKTKRTSAEKEVEKRLSLMSLDDGLRTETVEASETMEDRKAESAEQGQT